MSSLSEKTRVPLGWVIAVIVAAASVLVWALNDRAVVQRERLLTLGELQKLGARVEIHEKQEAHDGAIPRRELEKDLNRFKEDVVEIKAELKEIKGIVQAIRSGGGMNE